MILLLQILISTFVPMPKRRYIRWLDNDTCCRRHENRNWVTIVEGGFDISIHSIWDTLLFLDWAKECSFVSRHLFHVTSFVAHHGSLGRQHCNLGTSPWSRRLRSVGFAHARFDWVDRRVREFYWWRNSPFVCLCQSRSCKERGRRKHGGHGSKW